MSFDEIGRLDAIRSVIVVEGGWPVKAWRIRYFEEDRFLSLVSEPPSPPLLKTRATLRPEAQVKPAAPIATASVEAESEEQSGTSDKGDAGGGVTLVGQDRTAEPRAFLDAGEAALASADPARHEKDARDGGEADATENTATDVKRERQTDKPVSADNRFDMASGEDLYAEARRLAVMHSFPHIADEVQDTTMAVSRIVRG